MKVKDLISELQKIEDKEQEVVVWVTSAGDDENFMEFSEPLYDMTVKQFIDKWTHDKFVMIKFIR